MIKLETNNLYYIESLYLATRFEINIQVIKSCSNDLFEEGLLSFFNVSSTFSFSSGKHLNFFSSTRLFNFTFKFFLSFSLGILFRQDLQSSKPVIGLKLNQTLLIIVDESKSDTSASTERSSKSEEHNVFSVPFKFGRKQLLKLFQRHVRLALVKNLKHYFFSSQQLVNSNPFSSDGDGHKLMI